MNNKHMHNVILNKETCAGMGCVGTHVCHCSVLLTHVGLSSHAWGQLTSQFEGKFDRMQFVGTVATSAIYVFIEWLSQSFIPYPLQASLYRVCQGEGE